MLRIPVTIACAFNFRLDFYFNFGPKLPSAITGYWPSIHVSDNAKLALHKSAADWSPLRLHA